MLGCLKLVGNSQIVPERVCVPGGTVPLLSHLLSELICCGESGQNTNAVLAFIASNANLSTLTIKHPFTRLVLTADSEQVIFLDRSSRQ